MKIEGITAELFLSFTTIDVQFFMLQYLLLMFLVFWGATPDFKALYSVYFSHSFEVISSTYHSFSRKLLMLSLHSRKGSVTF